MIAGSLRWRAAVWVFAKSARIAVKVAGKGTTLTGTKGEGSSSTRRGNERESMMRLEIKRVERLS